MTQQPEPTDVGVLRTAARKGRAAFASSPLSKFVRLMQDVIRDYLTAREDGVAREDAVRGIEAVLREAWPVRASYFTPCAACDDSGWRLTECVHGMRCARKRCGLAESSWWHRYAVPCDCAHGDRQRTRLLQVDDELAAIGKKAARKKAGGFSRMGR